MRTSYFFRGFTLIEILIFLGLVGMVAFIPAIRGLESIGNALRYEDVERIEYALRITRASAQARICHFDPCTTPQLQGLQAGSRALLLFEDASLSASKVHTSYSLSGHAEVDSEAVIFLPGSGESEEGEIPIHRPDGSRHLIMIGSTGMVDHRVHP